ncbi:MAG: outer membrane protein multidrug efflux system [Acetobacteraceae bacterium]|nr:outer membrane protein multidrug efflux system [Acetobacteraceae bacterium]
MTGANNRLGLGRFAAHARSALKLTAPVLVALSGLCGCDLAPPYRPPHYVLPANYQGSPPFKVAHPLDTLPRGPWWERFDDPLLNQLEQQLTAENPDLAAMAEEYTQARDLAAEARAGLFPQVTANGLLSDNKESPHRLFRNPNSAAPLVEASNEILAGASWEPDFWSQIRNRTRAQKRLAQYSAAALAAARLSLQAELADDYIALRGLDRQLAIYRASITYYEQAVHITMQRLQGQIGAALDVARSRGQLASTQALLNGAVGNRAVLQHAIAVLVNVNPSSFSIPQAAVAWPTAPDVPVGVPSSLLQRRPDIAGAERQMASANAGIGVSRAAFYPNITLSANAGFEAAGFGLLSLSNSLWMIGASAVVPLFEGGLRRAELQRSWSQYAQTRDDYRSIVLSAFQEVEDGLALTTNLQAQAQQQSQAVTEAGKAQTLTLQLYVGGLTNYLDVVVAQQTELTALTTEVQVEVSRLQASVGLIRALGGGWSTADLPSENGVLPFGPLDYAGNDRQPRPDGTDPDVEDASGHRSLSQ